MSYAIPLVLVSDADTRDAAIREANQFADHQGIGAIAHIGEPVAFDLDVEDLDAPDPEYHCVVEVR